MKLGALFRASQNDLSPETNLARMTPPPDASGRPIDALLAAYAAGTLPRPLHALVASHLALSTENRVYVSTLEALKGDDLAREAVGAPVSRRDEKLAAIFQLDADPSAPDDLGDGVFPQPLIDFVGRRAADVPWRTKLPGIKEYVVSDDADGEASLFWIRPGVALPTHTHEGSEVTLVLAGGFADAYGDYDRGDVAIADEAVDHRPVADAAEGCLCFAVTEAPVRLTGPFGRIFDRIFRR